MDIQSLDPLHLAIAHPCGFLDLFLGINIFLFAGSQHIPLVLGTVVACIVGLFLGFSWRQMEESIVQGIMVAIQACSSCW
jgi:NhaC family Na+:H+ antiporter